MNLAEVKLWGATIGYVAWDSERQCGVFEYDPDFKKSDIQLAPQQMPLSDEIYSFPTLNKDTFKGLPGLLADTLPDKFGNVLIDQWLAETGRSPESFNPVERLTYVGTRGMGALEFHPSLDNTFTDTLSLDIEELVKLSSKILTLKEQQQLELKPENKHENPGSQLRQLYHKVPAD